MLRLFGAPSAFPTGRIMSAQAALGEALWRPPAPNGYPDMAAAWIDGVAHRLDVANGFTGQFPANSADPRALLG